MSDEVIYGEPIEEREPTYREGYIQGIYRARNIIDNKQKEIERLNTDKEQLTSLVNNCQEEIRKLKTQLQQKENIIKGLDNTIENLQEVVEHKENIIKEVREDLYQVVKWCTENKHNEDTIERYLVVDYGTIVGKINEIRTKLDKENKE